MAPEKIASSSAPVSGSWFGKYTATAGLVVSGSDYYMFGRRPSDVRVSPGLAKDHIHSAKEPKESAECLLRRLLPN